MTDFICKKCGSTEYEIKDKPNGTGIAHGLYCAKCGFWHKWLGKEELKQYATKESKDEIIAKLQFENAALRERLEKAVEPPCELGDKLYFVNEYLETPKIEEHIVTAFTILPYCIKVYVQNGGYFLPDNENVCFDREAAEARLKELQGVKQ